MEDSDQDDIFASPSRKRGSDNGSSQSNGSSSQKKKKAKRTNDVVVVKEEDSFRSLAMNLPVASFSTTTGTTTTTTTTGKKKKQQLQQTERTSPTEEIDLSSSSGGFRSLASSLPVASFSTMGGGSTKSTNGIKKEEAPSPAPTTKTVESAPNSTGKKKKKKKQLPLPNSTETGKKWTKAVVKCREHDRYAPSFDFAACKERCIEAGVTAEWIKAKPFGKWCSGNPQVIAIDCEMCETTDPESGSRNTKALCRLSVINAERPDEVILDTLVKPSWPVSDYRTKINGISKEKLEGVEFTLGHAQSFMMSLCSDETVIIGHAVHNDLVTLHMEHHCVVDSSLLFRAKDSPTSSASLKDLVSGIFKEKMPAIHDSVNDARKALDCALHWVKNDGKVADIQRSTNNARAAQLFVHRVPKHCKADHFISMFQNHTSIVPDEVDEIDFNGDTGRTHVTFKSYQHANLAFNTLEGASEGDKSGRLQKKVYLKGGGYVRIRKMVHERSSETPDKQRSTPDDS
ncbi:unnamed protein product [Cylindrotheca closterium]|uniref:Exonuclease domain-containing protein n=1 Tax=Cylindrotheca closterium TaxID=2856 RepID=A0AAD2GB61_9STRA|nr:unnamed protein product [Cylindrotheca closterium]